MSWQWTIFLIGGLVVFFGRIISKWAHSTAPPIQHGTAPATGGAHAPPATHTSTNTHHDTHTSESSKDGFFTTLWAIISGILWATVPIALVVIAVRSCENHPVVQRSSNPYAKTWTMVIIEKGPSQRRRVIATDATVTPPSLNMISWSYKVMSYWIIFNEELGAGKPVGKWHEPCQHGFFCVDGSNSPLASLSDWQSEIRGEFWDNGDDPNQPARYRFVLTPNPW